MQETTIKRAVRRYYALAADRGCCAPAASACCGQPEASSATEIPSFGCGTPVEAADLAPGERVLDLGAGRGLDAFRAAERVGAAGHVIGVDMTPEMVARAREDAQRLGYPQVEFRLGEIEALPLPDASVDVVVSNCVINLVPDKDRAFAEAWRVLRPGGRLVVADIVRARPAARAVSPVKWAACVDGADAEAVYLGRLRRAGFTAIEVLTRGAEDIYSLTLRARKP